MDLSREEFEGIVADYYKKHEDRNVRLDISAGKVRHVISNVKKQPAYALHFDLVEEIFDEHSGEMNVVSNPISEDDIAKAVSVVLEEKGFEAEEIGFNTVPVEDGIIFTGISVKGKQKESTQEKKM